MPPNTPTARPQNFWDYIATSSSPVVLPYPPQPFSHSKCHTHTLPFLFAFFLLCFWVPECSVLFKKDEACVVSRCSKPAPTCPPARLPARLPLTLTLGTVLFALTEQHGVQNARIVHNRFWDRFLCRAVLSTRERASGLASLLYVPSLPPSCCFG